jgi:hypothetical protein
MEFYNEKLLPKGLPELLCQVIPQEHYFSTKVIAYPRKHRRGVAGSVDFNHLINSWVIELYPTIIAFFFCQPHALGFRGTYSFDLWASFLYISLHEIGHMATWEAVMNVPSYYDEYGHIQDATLGHHFYIERLANKWAEQTIRQIVRVDPRMGQPEGPLGGYPGKLAYSETWGQPTLGGPHGLWAHSRMESHALWWASPYG